jgi:hypothetical protein
MENFDLECIHLSLKDAVNETLGDVAKDSIEGSNFQLLHIIAKLGIDLNTFIDGMFISPATVNVIEAHQAKTAETEEVYDAVEVEEVENASDDLEESYTATHQAPKSKFKYSLSVEETKEWIYNYLGKRGGSALYKDVLKQYYNEFSHGFSEKELEDEKWKSNIYHRVSEMRRTKNKIINLIEPLNGKRSDYYTLTVYALKNYEAETRKLESKVRQVTMDEIGVAF